MTADDEVTITVRRVDLQEVLAWGSPAGAAARVRAAIPPPPWEPSEEQIAAFLAADRELSPRSAVYAAVCLRRLHAAGLRLP